MIRTKRGSETEEGKAKKLKLFIPAGTVLILAVVLLIVLVIGRRFRATTMKLLSFEGTVTLSDTHGRDVAAEGKRLLDGNTLDTGKDSKAWVLLDDDRTVTLMEKSSAVFRQSGRDMVLSLEDGRLFFNISRPLEDEESFEIQTSTMVVGVRGTSGYVDSDENGNSVLYLTSGRVEVKGYDENGENPETARLHAGEKITVISGDDEVELIIEEITEADLPYDALLEILADKDLLDEVTGETGWDPEILKDLENMFLSQDDNGSDENEGFTVTDSDIVGTWGYDGVPLYEFFVDGTGYLYMKYVEIESVEVTYDKVSLIWYRDEDAVVYTFNFIGDAVDGRLEYCTLEDGKLGLKKGNEILVKDFGVSDEGDDSTLVTTDMVIAGTWQARNPAWPDIIFFDDGTGYLRYAPHSVEGFTYEYTGSAWTIYPYNDQNSYNCFLNADGLYVTGWQYYDRLSETDYYGEYTAAADGPEPEDIIGSWYDKYSYTTYYINDDYTVVSDYSSGTWTITDGTVVFSGIELRYKDGVIQKGYVPAENSQLPVEDGFIWMDLERV